MTPFDLPNLSVHVELDGAYLFTHTAAITASSFYILMVMQQRYFTFC